MPFARCMVITSGWPAVAAFRSTQRIADAALTESTHEAVAPSWLRTRTAIKARLYVSSVEP